MDFFFHFEFWECQSTAIEHPFWWNTLLPGSNDYLKNVVFALGDFTASSRETLVAHWWCSNKEENVRQEDLPLGVPKASNWRASLSVPSLQEAISWMSWMDGGIRETQSFKAGGRIMAYGKYYLHVCQIIVISTCSMTLSVSKPPLKHI